MHLHSSVVFSVSLTELMPYVVNLVPAMFLARLYLHYSTSLYNVAYPVDIIILQTSTCVRTKSGTEIYLIFDNLLSVQKLL